MFELQIRRLHFYSPTPYREKTPSRGCIIKWFSNWTGKSLFNLTWMGSHWWIPEVLLPIHSNFSRVYQTCTNGDKLMTLNIPAINQLCHVGKVQTSRIIIFTCWGWCMLASQCRGYDGRCRRWPHCRPWRHSQSAPGLCGWSGWSCRAQPQRWRPRMLRKLISAIFSFHFSQFITQKFIIQYLIFVFDISNLLSSATNSYALN